MPGTKSAAEAGPEQAEGGDDPEELGEEMAPLDYVCSRALGEFPNFLEWARSEQIAAKRVILWIGARDLLEVQSINAWEWQEPIPVPHSLRRLLLVGNKKSSSASTSLPAIA